MRAPRLATLLVCVVGCGGAPATGESEADEPASTDSVAGEKAGPKAEASPGESELAVPRFDATLAQARAQVRQGQLALSARTQLLASSNPDHRHAARLLQAVAGETPDPVLSRAGSRILAAGASARPTLEREGPRPSAGAEGSEPPPAGEREAAEGEGAPAEALPAPAVEREPSPLGEGAPADEPAAEHSAETPADAAPEAPGPLFDRDFGVERALLLEERPPREQAQTLPRDAPRLVILTSLALTGSGERVNLELAGAGTVELEALPIGDYHLRLSVVGAGAVPGFLDASPQLEGVAVVSVERLERVIEIEVEFAPGWRLLSTASSSNGARAEFGFVELVIEQDELVLEDEPAVEEASP